MSSVAVITGAAQGIGRVIAELLAARGYRLVLIDRTICAGAPAGSLTAQGSVTDEEFIRHTARQAIDRFGQVDVLVNNAGISSIQPAEEISLAGWRRVLDVNLTAPFLLCQVFGAQMLRQRSGAIVNIASVAGLAGVADRVAYNASKHGLIGMTRTLAAEWGGRGVRCNAVCPGWVKTEMDAADQGSGAYSDEDIQGRVPMGRFAKPADIANAVAFLADPEQSGFVNGHCLTVDGGWLADASWESLRRNCQKRGDF